MFCFKLGFPPQFNLLASHNVTRIRTADNIFNFLCVKLRSIVSDAVRLEEKNVY